MSTILVALVAIVIILPLTAHAFGIRPVYGGTDGAVGNGYIVRGNPGSGQGSVTVVGSSNGQLTTTTISPNNNGYSVTLTTYNSHAQPVSQTTINVGPASKYTFTTYNTQTTITKTYTQYIYDTYVVDHYIYNYMYPILNWVFTLTNIGQLQAPGYHNVGNEKLFLPGFGSGGGIFVPVFAQEAVYVFNIAPTTKPQITGWYVGSTSQSSSGPRLVSQSSTPPQLSSIQQTVNTIQNQASFTVPNISKTTTYWNYITQPGQNNTMIVLPTPYYYSNPNQNFALALQNLLQGNIAGAAYYTGKGIYENLWNAGAWAVQQAFYFVSQASNAFNTATLAKAVAAGIYGGVEGVGNALGQLFTKSWWSWP